jgi:hypothetical protein
MHFFASNLSALLGMEVGVITGRCYAALIFLPM